MATSLAGVMVTDGWAQAKHVVARLWRRARPGGTDAIADELDSTRAELLEAHQTGDAGLADDLVAEWRSRLRRLLMTDPEAAAELGEVLLLLRKLTADQPAAGHQVTFGPVVQTGSGTVNQVGVGTLETPHDE
jgi:hypothetical protein